jgi:hypothetical protein
VVDKRDDLGKVSGSRVCVDLKAINKVMLPDLYPLPTLQEVLSKAVRCRGPESYRFKIDGTQSYHRFEIKQKIICFKCQRLNGYYGKCAWAPYMCGLPILNMLLVV